MVLGLSRKEVVVVGRNVVSYCHSGSPARCDEQEGHSIVRTLLGRVMQWWHGIGCTWGTVIFLAAIAALYVPMSVGRSVCRSVCRSVGL